MTPIRVVSPHLDDAAFSMAASLKAFAVYALPFGLVNCFTFTDYAPLAGTDDPTYVSTLRAQEDRAFRNAVGETISAVNLGRLDAPIRRSESYERACRTGRFSPQDREEITALAKLLQSAAPAGGLFLPLALGGHIDHRIAKEAGLVAARPRVVGFYEELPYAMWGCDAEILLAVREAARSIGSALTPLVVSPGESAAGKFRLISVYRSQVARAEMERIAAFGALSRGGERLWVTDQFCELLRAHSVPYRPLPSERGNVVALRVSAAAFRLRGSLNRGLRLDRVLARLPFRGKGGVLVR